ncbi:MAG: hypothetical protein OHK0022_05480 [Roseiflexaceae bacterium]
MEPLLIRLFGKLSIQRHAQELSCFRARKVQELLCYLVLHRNRPHGREALSDVLWSDATAIQAKKGFRQSLWLLQSALEESGCGDGSVPTLLVDAEWVQFNCEASHWIDVAEFERVFGLVRDLPGTALDQGVAQELRGAVQLYRADLLEGWYQDWCLFERERLQSIYLGMLDRLMDYSEQWGEYDAGLAYGVTILRYDAAREHTHRRLMRLHHWAGNRTAALRQFEQCAAALRDELGAEPSRRTLDLRDRILADDLSPLPSAVAEPLEQAVGAPEEVLGYLRSLQQLLAVAQSRLQSSIDAAEATLRRSRRA